MGSEAEEGIIMGDRPPDGYFDMRGVPSAASVRVMWCHDPEGLCRRPHVLLLDEADKPIAQFVMPDPHPDGSGFFHDLSNAVYRSAMLRDKQ